jgi:hypothetical protein
MAQPRFQVNGSGDWSDSAHWAATSGGSGGQSVPDASKVVIIDANSGPVVTLDVDAQCGRFSAGFTGEITGSGTLACHSNFAISAGVTWSGTGNIAIVASAGSINTAGVVLPSLSFDGGTLTLLSDVTLHGSFTLISGTVNNNGHTITENA